jgi:hypothetical protein
MNGENALSRLAAVCLLLLLALSAAPLFAKEGTAHLTFEKGKAAQRDTFLYTIKKGDTLFALVTAVYRPESVVARRHIYGAVKKLNPRVTSIHVIYTGQRMRLPKPHLFSDGGTAPAVEIGGNKKIVEVASAPAASSLPPPPLPIRLSHGRRQGGPGADERRPHDNGKLLYPPAAIRPHHDRLRADTRRGAGGWKHYPA